MINYTCPDCGKTLCSFDEKYVQDNPTGFELACEQAQLRHDTDAHPETWHREICPDCGQEIGSWPQEYLVNNPNASDMAIGDAYAEHYLSCPASEYASTPENWQRWRQDAGAHDNETPRALVRRLAVAGHGVDEIYAMVPVPPDRWTVRGGQIISNWYDEIVYLID